MAFQIIDSTYDADWPQTIARMVECCTKHPERVLPVYTSRCVVCGSGDLGLDINDRVLCNRRDQHV